MREKSAKSKGTSPAESTREKGQRDDAAQRCEAKCLRTKPNNKPPRSEMTTKACFWSSSLSVALIWPLTLSENHEGLFVNCKWNLGQVPLQHEQQSHVIKQRHRKQLEKEKAVIFCFETNTAHFTAAS